jgi:hypothetical protein
LRRDRGRLIPSESSTRGSAPSTIRAMRDSFTRAVRWTRVKIAGSRRCSRWTRLSSEMYSRPPARRPARGSHVAAVVGQDHRGGAALARVRGDDDAVAREHAGREADEERSGAPHPADRPRRDAAGDLRGLIEQQDAERREQAHRRGGVPPPVVRPVIEHHARQDQERERRRDGGDAAGARREPSALDPRPEQPIDRAVPSRPGHRRYSTRRGSCAMTAWSVDPTAWSGPPWCGGGEGAWWAPRRKTP